MSVTLILTEHARALTPETLASYAVLRERLEQASGATVTAVQYEQVSNLDGADAAVLSGSFAPWAEHAPDALERLGHAVLGYDGPVLGICAGMQLQARFLGGATRHSASGLELGFASVEVVEADGLFEGLPPRLDVYEHHSDEIAELPPSFRVLARSESCAIEAIAEPSRRWWGTQFHPEAFDDAHPLGERILRNFFQLARSS